MDCMGTEKKRLEFFFWVLLTENDFMIHCFILLVFPDGVCRLRETREFSKYNAAKQLTLNF